MLTLPSASRTTGDTSSWGTQAALKVLFGNDSGHGEVTELLKRIYHINTASSTCSGGNQDFTEGSLTRLSIAGACSEVKLPAPRSGESNHLT